MKRSLIFCLCLFLLAGCSSKLTQPDVEKEPNFSGIVLRVYEDSLLVRVGPEEEEYRSSDRVTVFLPTEMESDGLAFQVGDEVRVYYDGIIAETSPAQISHVYAVTRVPSAESTELGESTSSARTG